MNSLAFVPGNHDHSGMDSPLSRRRNSIVLAGVLLLCLGGCFLVQTRKAQRLQVANAALREQILNLEATQPKNSPAGQTQADANELAQLRSGKSELLRLRSEVGQLRRQLKESSPLRSAVRTNSVTPTVVTETNLPYQAYTALSRATLAWDDTLVSGGWSIHPGKRVLVFLSPGLVAEGDASGQAPRQVTFQSTIIEVPDEVLSQLGLDAIKATGKEASALTTLSKDARKQIISSLEQLPGNDLMYMPVVTTLAGRQCQMKVVDVKSLPSGETYEVGTIVDVTSQLSNDGRSVDLTVIAKQHVPNSSVP